MVLESILATKSVIKNPIDMLIFSMIISFVSVYLADMIFPGSSTGKIITLFITVGITPMIYGIFKDEEEVEREEAECKIKESFFCRHSKTIWLFSLFFIGVFISLFMVASFSDEKYVRYIFQDQLSEIERVTSMSRPTGAYVSSEILDIIISNNLRVMGLSFILSFILGSGAIIILAWNASILALYLSSFFRQGLMEEFMIRSISLIPHAPIEIAAYFLAGISGGILSVGVIREKIFSKEFALVFRDSLILMALSVAAVLVGAVVEVFA
jgi:uncharacterized membrane protein SpoIIM required for sporulation